MAFITCNQRMGLILFTKQSTFTFAMHGKVSKADNNALLLQTMLYQKWDHVVMDDVIYYRTKKCTLILSVFQDSILVSFVETLTFVKYIG